VSSRSIKEEKQECKQGAVGIWRVGVGVEKKEMKEYILKSRRNMSGKGRSREMKSEKEQQCGRSRNMKGEKEQK
jgi:hypothetical protein